jgi:hypothetical protein
MAIKKVGGRAPIAAARPVEQKETATVGGFAEVAGAKASIRGPEAEIALAVDEVARAVAAGALHDVQSQVDAVIEKMIELQAPEGASPKAIRARVAEVQLAVGDHPGFASRVQAMLAQALESLEG